MLGVDSRPVSRAHTLSEKVEEWIRYLDLMRGCSEHTLKAYRRDLGLFRDFLWDEGVREWGAVSRKEVRAFTRKRAREIGEAPSTIQRRLSSIRSFYRHLLRHDEAEQNPAKDVRGPKTPKSLPDFLSQEETEKLFAHLEREAREGAFRAVRDLAIFEAFYSTGCRLSALAAVDIGDLRLDGRDGGGSVLLREKRRKDLYGVLGRHAVRALMRYLRRRKRKAVQEERGLFIGAHGRLTARRIQQIVAERSEAALGRKIHPHAIRHSFATHLMDEGADLLAVKEMLGHESISTTGRYLHLSRRRIQKVYDSAHPRARGAQDVH